MRKRLILIGVVVAVSLVLVAPSALAGRGAVQGTAYDPGAMWLGEIRYLGNRPGYHFWFTPAADGGPYLAGHSYHNVYKFSVEDTSEWCGPVNIPDRPPYNLAAPPGGTAYYKIFDTTTDTQVCP